MAWFAQPESAKPCLTVSQPACGVKLLSGMRRAASRSAKDSAHEPSEVGAPARQVGSSGSVSGQVCTKRYGFSAQAPA